MFHAGAQVFSYQRLCKSRATGISQKQAERPTHKALATKYMPSTERERKQIDLKTPAPKYADNPYAEPASVTGTLTSDNIAIVKVSLFPGKIVVQFANTLSNLLRNRLSGADRVLIDLRGNPGGGIGNLRLMGLLTSRQQPVGYISIVLPRKKALRKRILYDWQNPVQEVGTHPTCH